MVVVWSKQRFEGSVIDDLISLTIIFGEDQKGKSHHERKAFLKKLFYLWGCGGSAFCCISLLTFSLLRYRLMASPAPSKISCT